ncbi:hypothetical protein [Bacillus alkalicellulosilyticus]|uniref:hypothetical protein n=1 Tax=Alkalihalobacterium alkalicellulosilyticum TaxID=1912214 RepID=UPI0009983560|nr:hypothetical protein [Bacillus alkalicellulosilyticus]
MVRNNISKILFGLGILSLIIGFFTGGISADYGLLYVFTWWLGSFIFGMMLIGFSEIIDVLHKLNNGQQKLLDIHTATGEEDNTVKE